MIKYLIVLDKIVNSTGSNTDYLLYGKNEEDNKVRKHINRFLDRSDTDE